jgi:hypothetical protein
MKVEDKGGSNKIFIDWFFRIFFLCCCPSQGLNLSLFSSSFLSHIPLILLSPSGQPIKEFFIADLLPVSQSKLFSFWSSSQIILYSTADLLLISQSKPSLPLFSFWFTSQGILYSSSPSG